MQLIFYNTKSPKYSVLELKVFSKDTIAQFAATNHSTVCPCIYTHHMQFFFHKPYASKQMFTALFRSLLENITKHRYETSVPLLGNSVFLFVDSGKPYRTKNSRCFHCSCTLRNIKQDRLETMFHCLYTLSNRSKHW